MQASLFGDDVGTHEDEPTTATTDPTSSSANRARTAAAVNDMDLVESVVRAATETGYLIIGEGQAARVLLRDVTRRGWTVAVPVYEATAVVQLLAAGLLRRGGAHHVRYGDHEGPADGVLVPDATKAMLRRWAALRPMPRQRR